MVLYQILQTNITRIIWQTVRKTANKFLGIKLFRPFFRHLSSLCMFTAFVNPKSPIFLFLRVEITVLWVQEVAG